MVVEDLLDHVKVATDLFWRAEVDRRLFLRTPPRSPSSNAPGHIDGRPIPLEPAANERLGELSAPVLVIAGELDASDFAHTAQHLAADAPNARAVIWPDVAHLIGMEVPVGAPTRIVREPFGRLDRSVEHALDEEAAALAETYEPLEPTLFARYRRGRARRGVPDRA